MSVTLLSFGVRSAAYAQCEPCALAIDNWCEMMPRIVDPEFTAPLRGAIETRAPNPSGGNYCVTLYDITENIPSEDTNWDPLRRYHGPSGSWNVANLGTVFGLTLDVYGNIYVCHTSCYATDGVGPGGAGAVYRIDGATGAISTFATLPNFSDPNLTAPNDEPGLGNMSYDCARNQFFVTDLENGKIYRLQSPNPLNASPATVVDFFDPLGPDNGLPGFAPLGERLWAVQWHGGRVYYSVWAGDFGSYVGGNTIRSVALDVTTGEFVWASDRHELLVPAYPGQGTSGPVSDISFGPSGSMLLGERTMANGTTPSAHQARVLEYQCGGGTWTGAGSHFVGVAAQTEAAGGVDYDYEAYDGPSPPGSAPPGLGGSKGRVWATADAIHAGSPYPDVVRGLQALRPTGGSVTTSLILDSDGDLMNAEDSFLGDVEIPRHSGPVAVEDRDDLDRARAWVSPTPWRGSGTLHFVNPRASFVTVTLLDVTGRSVRTLAEHRWLPSGRHILALDGRDDRGHALPSGVYLYRVASPERVLVGRFVIAR